MVTLLASTSLVVAMDPGGFHDEMARELSLELERRLVGW